MKRQRQNDDDDQRQQMMEMANMNPWGINIELKLIDELSDVDNMIDEN